MNDELDRRIAELVRRYGAVPVPRVRRHAIHALTCVKCNGRPIAEAALDDLARCARDDPSVRVRREAAAALRRTQALSV